MKMFWKPVRCMEMLGKMTVVSNDLVLVCISNTNTTPVAAVR